MTDETDPDCSTGTDDEQHHDIPEWYIPDGPVRIGGAGDPDRDALDSPRLDTAIKNGHEMFGLADTHTDDPGNRDREGRLSCRRCNCDGRDLELIECAARHYGHTRVSLSEDQLEELRRQAERTGQPVTPR